MALNLFRNLREGDSTGNVQQYAFNFEMNHRETASDQEVIPMGWKSISIFFYGYCELFSKRPWWSNLFPLSVKGLSIMSR